MKIPRRRVLLINTDDEKDFAIDEDDYLVVRHILTIAGVPETDVLSETRKIVGISENDVERRVASLDLNLRFNCLATLPYEIGNLTSLNTLDLSLSDIESLPSSIGRLKKLKNLNLEHTKELASLPDEIGDLISLNELNLAESTISSLPPSIGRLKKLKNVNLYNTEELASLPDEIGDLISLNELNLAESDIESLPSSIGRLKNLKNLNLSCTKELASLPDEIGDLISLNELNLVESNISSLPSSIGRLKNLRKLHLTATEKLLNLPDEIGHLVGLNKLDLDASNITSLPPSIGRLKNLKKLRLAHTEKLLNLPDEIGNLIGLTTLILSGSNITSLPPSIGRLQKLIELDLTDTKAVIPRSVNQLRNLTELELSGLSNLEKFDTNLKLTVLVLNSLSEAEMDVSSLTDSIGRIAGLRHLDFGNREYDETLQEILLILVQRCPLLGFVNFYREEFEDDFDSGEGIKYEEELDVALAQNRLRSRLWFGETTEDKDDSVEIKIETLRTTQKLWPLVLYDAPRAFDWYPETRALEGCSEFDIFKPDAIYQILVHCRESFLGILHHRSLRA